MIFKLVVLIILILNIWYLLESVGRNDTASITIHLIGATGALIALVL